MCFFQNLVSSPLKDQVLQGTTEKVSEKKEVIKDKSIVNNVSFLYAYIYFEVKNLKLTCLSFNSCFP